EAGMSPEEARRQASKSFGNLSVIEERCRDVKGGGVVETVLADLRYGVRMLARSPIFTAVAVVTLALGVGANSAIFSVVNAVLLRSLPFDEPGRLVRVESTLEDGSLIPVASWKDFIDWRDQNHVFEQIAAFTSDNDSLTGSDGPERIDTADVSAGFFELLRVNPILGRTFSPDDRAGHRTGPNFAVYNPNAVSML